jgi:imidazole glycerol phosphate synthase glutamine amidotransferase subunit
MIGIIDYGAGNLNSVKKALSHLQLPSAIISRPDELSACDKLLLPGVGHFGSAMHSLQASALLPALKEWLQADRPFLGICLGMQLLFSDSEEAPGVQGLDFFKGHVRPYTCRPRLQIGWNTVNAIKSSAIWQKKTNDYYYFVNGYYVAPADREIVAAVSDYEVEFAAAVQCGRIWGVQFHPEKSAAIGLELLNRWGTS